MEEKGRSIRFMHRELGIHRQTIKRYLACEQFPNRTVGTTYYSKVTPYIAYLKKRWEAEGMQSPKQLWREIKEQGFKVAYGSVYRMTNRLFGTGGKGRPKKKVKNPPTLSGRKASIILGKNPEKHSLEEEKFCKILQQLCPEIKKSYPIIQDFVQMIKQQNVSSLDPWIKKAQECQISALVNFATGIVQDYDAIKAALEYEWSNGQVEGQVNRLKNIKRQMYGRASFKLLRKRVVYAPRPG